MAGSANRDAHARVMYARDGTLFRPFAAECSVAASTQIDSSVGVMAIMAAACQLVFVWVPSGSCREPLFQGLRRERRTFLIWFHLLAAQRLATAMSKQTGVDRKAASQGLNTFHHQLGTLFLETTCFHVFFYSTITCQSDT